MYSVGDAVFHPTNGAGVITKVERMPAIQSDLRFYKILMTDRNETVLRVPVTKADDLGLRPALPPAEVVQVLSILSGTPENLPEPNKDRYRACQERLDSAETEALAALVRDLAWRQIVADRLNAPAQRIFSQAKKLLAGELAVSQGTSVQAAEEQIQEALQRRPPQAA